MFISKKESTGYFRASFNHSVSAEVKHSVHTREVRPQLFLSPKRLVLDV